MADNYDQYSKEELLRLLRERDRKPRFGLVWERDEIEHDKSLNDDFVALDLDPNVSCGDAPFENLIIEGDNFDALRYLRMTHAGQVKCIYIDPPYNTGNRDFIYNDRFVDKDDAYRHSKWLEFMYRRLTLAKDLLSDEGVIFVSIDDNEMLHLGLLMNQVFGENNFVADFIWHHRKSSQNDIDVSLSHNYTFCFAKNRNNFKLNSLPIDDSKFSNPDNDFRGDWVADPMDAPNIRLNLMYPITNPNTGVVYLPPNGRHWRFTKEKFEEALNDARIVFGKTGKSKPQFKRFKSEAEEKGTNAFTIWDDVDTATEATKELMQLFGGNKIFDTPKPTSFILKILKLATNQNSIVLDFFAGSGTTAHAVMKLNAEDGGKRRYILVSSTEATGDAPDKNLCRDVCAERVRRVAQGYTNKKGEAVEGLGGSFAYLRTKRIPVARVFNDIQHEQVWRALQLVHRVPLTIYENDVLMQLAGNADDRLVYVPKLSQAVLDEVARLAALGGRLVVYSWQPGQIRQRVDAPNVAFEKIPEFLVSRFGGMAR
ncbi:MAG: site-specific DNA-methyltransferase [Gallionella sp.]|nr:site-specific DNA-methyltransferase [Gallionella sp.]